MSKSASQSPPPLAPRYIRRATNACLSLGIVGPHRGRAPVENARAPPALSRRNALDALIKPPVTSEVRYGLHHDSAKPWTVGLQPKLHIQSADPL